MRAGIVLAGRGALFGRLEAMIERIAHEVHQGIADLLQHGLVELGVLAGELEFDFLAQLAREIMDDARKAVERKADRQHAYLHHALLQFAGIARELREPLAQPIQFVRIDAIRETAEHRLRDEQFTDQIDDVIELLGGDADRAGFPARLLHRGDGRRRCAFGLNGLRRRTSCAAADSRRFGGE